MAHPRYPTVARLVGEHSAEAVRAALAVPPEQRTAAERDAARAFLAAGQAYHAERVGNRPRPSTRSFAQ